MQRLLEGNVSWKAVITVGITAVAAALVAKRFSQKRNAKTPPDTWAGHVRADARDLTQLTPELWTTSCDLAVHKDHARVMYIYRLPTGKLLLESCIAMPEKQMHQLDALGAVEIILVPNVSHRLDCRVYKERYPDAKVVCPAAARTKVEEVCHVDATSEDVLPQYGIQVFEAGLQQTCEMPVALPLADGTRALLISDLLFTTHAAQPWWVRALARLVGVTDKPAVSRTFRWFMLKDKPKTRTFLQQCIDDPVGYSALLISHCGPLLCSVEQMRIVLKDAVRSV
eukprot:TRINITY_DN2162_c0_g1_i2.p1 TRINITY_DN2162_c0_g1~~TRINITY_DN2162_c0_g1_i2.p1  ORF type:complete len:283 (+),score=49.42 TRINITY_DN2162_c0_g1_i2:64-912(+)